MNTKISNKTLPREEVMNQRRAHSSTEEDQVSQEQTPEAGEKRTIMESDHYEQLVKLIDERWEQKQAVTEEKQKAAQTEKQNSEMENEK